MKHMISADKQRNFITTVVTPAACATVPAIGGYLLATSKDPILTLLMFLAIVVSGLIQHILALDWRDTKLSNRALCVVLQERDKDIQDLQDPDRFAQSVKLLTREQALQNLGAHSGGPAE